MSDKCPDCNESLKKMYYIGLGKAPTKAGHGNAEDWTTSKKKYIEHERKNAFSEYVRRKNYMSGIKD